MADKQTDNRYEVEKKLIHLTAAPFRLKMYTLIS